MSEEKLKREVSQLTPAEAYTRREAETAIASSQMLLNHVSNWMQKLDDETQPN